MDEYEKQEIRNKKISRRWITLVIICGILLIGLIFNGVIAKYIYDKNIQSYYDLAVRASTADKKLEYLNTFDFRLRQNKLTTGNAAIIFKTPDTDAIHQYQVLETIEKRLQITSEMDPASFEYQQAMYEMSRTELSGDSEETYGYININVFEKVYYKKHNIFAHMTVAMWLTIILFSGIVFGFLRCYFK